MSKLQSVIGCIYAVCGFGIPKMCTLLKRFS